MADLKFELIGKVTIRIPDTWISDFLVSGIQMAFWCLCTQTIQKPDKNFQFLNGLGPQIPKCHLKTGQKCPVFRCHLNTGPFTNQTTFNHLNTGLVRYSDGYCIQMVSGCSVVQCLDFECFPEAGQNFRNSDAKNVWEPNVWIPNHLKTKYSGDLNSEHSNYGTIRITNFY